LLKFDRDFAPNPYALACALWADAPPGKRVRFLIDHSILHDVLAFIAKGTILSSNPVKIGWTMTASHLSAFIMSKIAWSIAGAARLSAIAV
jgi:hypothetical protein